MEINQTQSTHPFFFSDQQERNTMAIETLSVPPNSNQNSVYLNLEGDDVPTTEPTTEPTDEPTVEDATSNENPAVEDNVAPEADQLAEEDVGTTPAPVTEPIVAPTPPAKQEATVVNMNTGDNKTPTATPAVKDGASPVPIDMPAVTENVTETNEQKKAKKKKTITIAILCTLFVLLALGGISYGIYY